MNREELLEMKRQVDSEYKADIAALNQLLKRYPAPEIRTETFDVAGMESTKSMFEHVRESVEGLNKNFTLGDIVALVHGITGNPPEKKTISTALFRLKAENKIKVIQNGVGRRAAIYART